MQRVTKSNVRWTIYVPNVKSKIVKTKKNTKIYNHGEHKFFLLKAKEAQTEDLKCGFH
jgi:hypothetical protein